jgi:hypothetical protein
MQLVVEDLAPKAVRTWNLTPVGVVKVNWDATVNKKQGCVGIVIVAVIVKVCFWVQNVCFVR